MRSTSKITFSLENEQMANDLFNVLNPEIGSDKRAQTNITVKGMKVHLEILAGDRAAHRAAVNSYGRWLRLYVETGGIK